MVELEPTKTLIERWSRWAGLPLALVMLLVLKTPLASGQSGPALPGLSPIEPALGEGSEAPEEFSVEYSGAVLPGKRIKLQLQGVEAPGSRYEWTQIEGPPVQIDQPGEPQVSLVVPNDAHRLAFLLTVSDSSGRIRRYRVNVPVQQADEPSGLIGDLEVRACRASAGDDLVGLVGRRMTLDGSESEPAGTLLYRWLQVAGPAIGEPRQDGPYYSFRPLAPGVHRFALIVAGQGAISEPDFVTVTVGELPPANDRPRSVSASAPTESRDPALSLVALGAALAPRGDALAGPLADAFEQAAVHGQGSATFGAIQGELARRCDAIIPSDPASRSQWSRLVLEPLTQYTVNQLAPVGLDPSWAASSQAPMTPEQRERLSQVYRSIAQALREQAAPAP